MQFKRIRWQIKTYFTNYGAAIRHSRFFRERRYKVQARKSGYWGRENEIEKKGKVSREEEDLIKKIMTGNFGFSKPKEEEENKEEMEKTE